MFPDDKDFFSHGKGQVILSGQVKNPFQGLKHDVLRPDGFRQGVSLGSRQLSIMTHGALVLTVFQPGDPLIQLCRLDRLPKVGCENSICKTKDNSSPQGKPRVYYNGHPEDLSIYSPNIFQDILGQESILDQEKALDYYRRSLNASERAWKMGITKDSAEECFAACIQMAQALMESGVLQLAGEYVQKAFFVYKKRTEELAEDKSMWKKFTSAFEALRQSAVSRLSQEGKSHDPVGKILLSPGI